MRQEGRQHSLARASLSSCAVPGRQAGAERVHSGHGAAATGSGRVDRAPGDPYAQPTQPLAVTRTSGLHQQSHQHAAAHDCATHAKPPLDKEDGAQPALRSSPAAQTVQVDMGEPCQQSRAESTGAGTLVQLAQPAGGYPGSARRMDGHVDSHLEVDVGGHCSASGGQLKNLSTTGDAP